MARTINQIFGEMVALKEETPELDGLTSSSNTAVWRLIMYICAVGISVVENLFDLHSEQMDQAAENAIAGSLNWYASETLLYQHGDTLVYNSKTGSFGYTEDQPDLRVVKLSSATDDRSGSTYVKAAKINESTNQAEPLSVNELSGLTGYWDQKKFAGTILGVFSDNPDKLRIAYRILYDATILNSNGELLSDTTIKPVEDSINNYLIEFGVSNFNGLFQLMRLTDAVQAANGVLNAVVTLAEAVKDDDTGLIDILAQQDHIYTTVAGYLVINPTYPLVNTIVYEAQL